MNVIGYSFNAAIHCVDCTRRQRFNFGRMIACDPDQRKPDENDIRGDALDREWNPVHPVFSTDEGAHNECCDDCFRRLI